MSGRLLGPSISKARRTQKRKADLSFDQTSAGSGTSWTITRKRQAFVATSQPLKRHNPRHKLNLDDEPNVDRIVVGIDFGTTFSGVAFAYVGQKQTIKSIKKYSFISIIDSACLARSRWPGRPGTSFEKTPSILSYEGDSVRFGFEAERSRSALRYCKLLLGGDHEFPPWLGKCELEQQLQQHDKTVVEVVSDYLSKLISQAKKGIETAYGNPMGTNTQLDFVLSIPAIWPTCAQELMLSAAKRAGAGSSVRLVSEPEAAGIYTMRHMDGARLDKRDVFVLCDVGGGTVDLIAYEIKDLIGPRIREVNSASGDLCGSQFLDLAFENWVKSKIGETAFQELKTLHFHAWMQVKSFFDEHTKRDFDAVEDVEQQRGFIIPILMPVLPGLEYRSGFLLVPYDDVAAMFRPIVQRIIDLLAAQIAGVKRQGLKVSAIMLAGGFGESEHLRKVLINHFSSHGKQLFAEEDDDPRAEASKGLQIIQAPDAWQAVVRGAVRHGLRDHVTSRRAKFSYGIVWDFPFDEDIHDEDDKYFHEATRTCYAKDQMKWFLVKNQAAITSKATCHEFEMTYDVDGIPEWIEFQLMSCKDDTTPESRTDGIMLHGKLFVPTSCIKTWKPIGESNSQRILSFKLALYMLPVGLRFEARMTNKKEDWHEIIIDYN